MKPDTIKIDLPPPPKRKHTRSRKGGVLSVALLTLIFGLAGGFFAGSNWSSSPQEKVDPSAAVEAPSAIQASEVDSLIMDARTAIASGDWVEARDLYQKALNRDATNQEALYSKNIVERHLDGARGGLNVATSPPGAVVKIGGQFSKKAPFETDDLPLGKYDVKISLEGHQPVTRSIVIEEDKIVELTDIQLKRSAGSLGVVSEPVGADFKIVKDTPSGEKPHPFIKIGKTPAVLEELEAGNYQVIVEVEGYPSYSEKVVVENNRKASVSAVFAKKSLNVKSDPPGAEIWVREEGKKEFVKHGETPIAIADLPLGRHQLEARYRDWQPIRRTVKLQPNITPELIDLKWKRAMVKLVSDPPGAQVYHYNQQLGNGNEVTPFITELPAGDFKLTAVHEKLDNVETDLVINGDEEGTVEARFPFEYGSISVKSDPAGAAIVLNGRPEGRTPRTFAVVRPGTYSLQLNKEGYRSGKVSGEVENGGQLNFDTKLKYDPTPKQNTNFKNSYGDEFVWIPEIGGWVGVTEVTQRTYYSVMSENPSQFKDENRPVDGISWYDAAKFCEKLTINENSRDALPRGFAYKLPTDQQWSIFAAGTELNQAVTSKDSRREGTAKVGSLQPNQFGLYDVRGNVWEWCQDWYSPTVMDRIRKSGSIATPSWSNSDRKVLRGGSWNRSSDSELNLNYRLAVRQGTQERYDVGIRVLLVPDR